MVALRLTPEDLVLVLHTKEDCLLLLVRLPVVVVVSVQRGGLVGGGRLGRGGGGGGGGGLRAYHSDSELAQMAAAFLLPANAYLQ